VGQATHVYEAYFTFKIHIILVTLYEIWGSQVYTIFLNVSSSRRLRYCPQTRFSNNFEVCYFQMKILTTRGFTIMFGKKKSFEWVTEDETVSIILTPSNHF
jgi:hypothetical protein